MAKHVVRTNHIQDLIANAMVLARKVNGLEAGTEFAVDARQRTTGTACVEHALCKAISDLRHAADELDAERLSCFGWQQS